MLLVAVLVIINNFLCQPSLFVHFGEDLFTTIPKAITRMQSLKGYELSGSDFWPKIIFGIEMMQCTKDFLIFMMFENTQIPNILFTSGEATLATIIL